MTQPLVPSYLSLQQQREITAHARMLADLEDITAARDDLPIGPEARQAIANAQRREKL